MTSEYSYEIIYDNGRTAHVTPESPARAAGRQFATELAREATAILARVGQATRERQSDIAVAKECDLL